MDQTGAVIGPLIVALSVARSHKFGPAFFQLGIPALLALAALVVARHYRPRNVTPPSVKPTQSLPRVFWMYVLASGLLAAGFLDFTLLGFHFQKTRLFQPETIPYLYAGGMGVVGITALVCGRLFDRHGVIVLCLGVLVTMLALPFGFLGGQIGGVLAVAFWAAGHGVQDATMRSGIAQVVSMNKRGSAFGAFNGVFGVMWFFGSVVMGLLYDRSLVALVVFGLAFQMASVVLFYWLRRPLAAAAAAT
jgi:predicted MFS family arabinose efflux permease